MPTSDQDHDLLIRISESVLAIKEDLVDLKENFHEWKKDFKEDLSAEKRRVDSLSKRVYMLIGGSMGIQIIFAVLANIKK